MEVGDHAGVELDGKEVGGVSMRGRGSGVYMGNVGLKS
jgi:hypothetical protein